jgi:hypothetical protein
MKRCLAWDRETERERERIMAALWVAPGQRGARL